MGNLCSFFPTIHIFRTDNHNHHLRGQLSGHNLSKKPNKAGFSNLRNQTRAIDSFYNNPQITVSLSGGKDKGLYCWAAFEIVNYTGLKCRFEMDLWSPRKVTLFFILTKVILPKITVPPTLQHLYDNLQYLTVGP